MLLCRIGFTSQQRLIDEEVPGFKNTAISERINTQFRAEFFNALNQNSFNVPGTALATPTFGVITGSTGGRVIQFALKLMF